MADKQQTYLDLLGARPKNTFIEASFFHMRCLALLYVLKKIQIPQWMVDYIIPSEKSREEYIST